MPALKNYHVICYAKLPVTFNLTAVKNELLLFEDGEWQPHFNNYHYEGEWKALPLRSPGGSYKNIIPDLLNGLAYEDTLFMQRFAAVKELLSSVYCPIMAVRFLKLKAGSVIKPHRDNELAFEKGEARLHFPVVTNPAVEFFIENERIPLNEGDCWYINANLPHSVANRGVNDRVHLIVDCIANDWLSEVISKSDKISFKEDHTRKDLVNIIKHLRFENTESSNKRAGEFEIQLKEITETLNNGIETAE